jgi:glycosyltransferase involved in cell wall biosynthesis
MSVAQGEESLVRQAVLRRRKVAILTNVLTPNRLPIFERLAAQFEVTVLFSGEESNRDQWRGLEHRVRGFTVKRVTGFNFTWTKREEGGVVDTKHLHVDPGLFTALLRLRPDAIITAEMGFRSLVAVTYGRLFRCPVWVWWGGTPHTERGIASGKRLFRRWLVARTPRWFSYGISSTEYLVSLGVPRQDVVELQNCVPEGAYRNGQPPLMQFETRPVLLCVGQLIRRKGVDLLLDAAARAQAEGLSFSLAVVGSGPEKPRLEQRAQELSLRNVRFYAPEPAERMPGVYRSADVLIFPTREDVWGLVANEALWSGLPALVSVYAGCAKEVVPSESTFDPLNPADFAAKIRRAVAGELPSPDLRRLKSIDEVSDLIAQDLNLALGPR